MKPKKKKRPQTRLLRKKDLFILAFRKTCDISAAAAAVGIERGMHYRWMDADEDYRAAFKATVPEVDDMIRGTIARLALKGYFEPNIHKGEFVYARRKRTMCLLADGTSAFEDELPKGAKVMERRSVQTKDGEQLGVWYIDTGMLAKLAAARMPEEYGNRVAVTADVTITSLDDARREFAREMAAIVSAVATDPAGGADQPPE